MMRRRHCLQAAALIACFSAPALAQSTYVGAGIVGDLFRQTHSESRGQTDSTASGEAVGFALRVGTPLGARWGVDLEFVRPGEIETDFSQGPIILARQLQAAGRGSAIAGAVAPDILRPFYQVEFRRRYTTLAASVWVQQNVSSKVALVYLAGMGFYRATHETEFSFDRARFGVGFPAIFPPPNTKTTVYGVRPLAGFEAKIHLTDHVDLVPGLRLHGLEGAWLVRPAVGLAWAF